MANNTDYTKPRTDLLSLLPNTLKTEINQAFLDNVVNRYLTKTELTPVYGAIGKKPTNIKTVNRILESSVHRQAYQLQPLIYKKVATVDHIASYKDLLTKAEMLGVDINRLPLWGDTQQFNFIPPIDLDKMVNWSQYFWFNPENPAEKPQYITIKNEHAIHSSRANEKRINLNNMIADGAFYDETDIDYNNRIALATAELYILDTINNYIINQGLLGWEINSLDSPQAGIGDAIYINSTPPNPVPGNKLWYNTTTNQINFYDGSHWIVPPYSHILDGLIDPSTGTLTLPTQTDWSRENKWIHQNEVTDITIAQRALMPIIEYNPQLEMNEWTFTKHIWAYRGSADQKWREVDNFPTIYEMGIRIKANVVSSVLILKDNHTQVCAAGTSFTAYSNTYVATGQEFDIISSQYDEATDTTTLHTNITSSYNNSEVLISPKLTTTSMSTDDEWVGFHKHWVLIRSELPVPVNTQVALDEDDVVGEDIPVMVARREFVLPGGVKFLPGTDSIRVYVNGVRQYGTYVENGHPNITASHIYFNDVVPVGTNVVIEISPAAKSDKYLMGSIPGEGIYVRTSTSDDFDAAYNATLTSLIRYRKVEQLKTQHTQYPLFDIFSIKGDTTYTANCIFAFEEDPSYPVNVRVNQRIKITGQGKEYYFNQMLLNSDNGELFCYKDKWSINAISNPSGLQTIWRTSDTARYVPRKVNEYRLADGDEYINDSNATAIAVVPDASADWEIPNQLMFNLHHENRKVLKYSEIITHFTSIVNSQDVPSGYEFMNANYYRLISNPNYGIGGTIKEHNNGYDTFISVLFQKTGSPRSVISFAQQQYEHNLLLVKEYFIRNAANILTTGSTDVNAMIDRITNDIITQVEQNDFLDNVFGDSTTYDAATGTGIMNWIATMPYLGMTLPTKPELLHDGNFVKYRILHHDGHMSTVSIPRSIKQIIYDQLTSQPIDWIAVDLDYVLAKIILEVETRLYQAVPVFDKLSFDFTSLMLTASEQEVFVEYMKDQYFEYITSHDYNPYTSTFNATDAFTWNYTNVPYSGSVRTDNRPVIWGSSWEAIYQSNFGTEYPHLMPWKLQGYNNRPVWWNIVYKDSLTDQWLPIMWQNIQLGKGAAGYPLPNGTIATGGVELVGYNFVCVDTITNQLLPPYHASTVPTELSFFNNWSQVSGATATIDDPYVFGQNGPTERQWKNSTEFLYGLAHIAFRMQPVRFLHEVFGNGYTTVAGLQVENTSKKVLSHRNTIFHGDVVNGKTVKFNGLNQWYVNYIRYHSTDVNVSDFRDMWTGWESRFSYQTGSFINTKSLELTSKHFSVIEQDYNVVIKKTPDMKDYWINALLVSTDTIGSDSTISGTAKIPRLYGEDWKFKITLPTATEPKIKYYGLKRYSCTLSDSTDAGVIIGTQSLPWAVEVDAPNPGDDLHYVPDETLTWFTGSPVQIHSSGSYPTPLTPNTTYYIIKVDSQTFKLAISYNDAVLGICIDIETPSVVGDVIYVEEIFSTFMATYGAVTTNIWKHYGLDKRVQLETHTPMVYTGVQTIINIIDGYVSYNEDMGWVFNDSIATEVDAETGQLVSWQTEIDRLINKIYTGLGGDTHINLTDLPVRMTSVTTYDHSGQFPISINGVPPTINGVTLNSGDRIYFPNVVDRVDAGIWMWFNTIDGVQWIKSENVDIDTSIAYHEVNPFRNNIWFNHEQGIITNIHTGPYTDIRINTTLYDQTGSPLNPSSIYIFRNDKLSRIRTCSLCGSSYAQSGVVSSNDNTTIRAYTDSHLGGAHIFLDGYEHTIMFNNYTTEGYLVFDSYLGLSVNKFSLSFERNNNDTLRPNVGGFFLHGNEMVQNIENTVTNIQHYYDTYQVNETAEFLDYARSILGYTPPEYLDYINIGPKSKFVFWKGMIQNKGATNTIRAFINARMFVDARVDEFWAYKVAEFGNTNHRLFNDVWIQPTDVSKGDLRLNFVTNNSEYESHVINILPNDDVRWVNFPDQRLAIDQINNFYFDVTVTQPLDRIVGFANEYIYMMTEPTDQIIITLKESVVDNHNYVILVEGVDYTRVNSKIIKFLTPINTGDVTLYGIGLNKSKYNPAKLIDHLTGTTIHSLMIWNPAFGHHYHVPMNRIDLQLFQDPAKYNNVFNDVVEHGYDPLYVWNSTEVKKTWLNTKSIGYVPYFDSSIFPNDIDRLRYWGNSAEWSTFGLYEWTESPVPPTAWNDYVLESSSDQTIDYYSKPTGTPIQVVYKQVIGLDSDNNTIAFASNPKQSFEVFVNGTGNPIYTLDRNWEYYTPNEWSTAKELGQVHPVISSTTLDTNIKHQQQLDTYVNGMYAGTINTTSVVSTTTEEEPTYKSDGDVYQVPSTATGTWERFASDVSYVHYPIQKTINRLIQWNESLGLWDRVPGDIRGGRPNPHPFPSDQDTYLIQVGSWGTGNAGDYVEWYESTPARWETVLSDYTKFSMTTTVLPLIPNTDIVYRVGNITINTDADESSAASQWKQASGIPPELVEPAVTVNRGDTYEVGGLEIVSIIPMPNANTYPTYRVDTLTPVVAKIPPSISVLTDTPDVVEGDVFTLAPIQELTTPPSSPNVGDVYKTSGVLDTDPTALPTLIVPKTPDTGDIYKVDTVDVITAAVPPIKYPVENINGTFSERDLRKGDVCRIGSRDIVPSNKLPDTPVWGDTIILSGIQVLNIPPTGSSSDTFIVGEYTTRNTPPSLPSWKNYYLVGENPEEEWAGFSGQFAEYHYQPSWSVINDCNTPPQTPVDEKYYLTGPEPTGEWATYPNQLVKFSNGAWRLEVDANTPPANPVSGDYYLVGPTPAGDWTGHAGELAWRMGGVGGMWIFTLPATIPPNYPEVHGLYLVGAADGTTAWGDYANSLVQYNEYTWVFTPNTWASFTPGQIVRYDSATDAWVIAPENQFKDHLDTPIQWNGEEWIVVPTEWLSNAGQTVQWDGYAWNDVPDAWAGFNGQTVTWNGHSWETIPDAWVSSTPAVVQWNGTEWVSPPNPWDGFAPGDMVQWNGTSWNEVPDAWKRFEGQIVQWDGTEWVELSNNPWEELLSGQVVQWNGTEWVELTGDWLVPGSLMSWNGSEWVTASNADVIHLGLSYTDGNQKVGDVFWFNHSLDTDEEDEFNYTTTVTSQQFYGDIVIIEDNLTLRVVVGNVTTRNDPPIPDKSPFAYITTSPDFINGSTYYVASGAEGTEWSELSSQFTQYIAATGQWVNPGWDTQTAKYTYDALTTTGAYVNIDQLSTYTRQEQDNITFVHDLLNRNILADSTESIQYTIDTPYTKVDEYDANQNVSNSKYYFWVEGGTTKPKPTIPAIIEVCDMLKRPNVPYLFAQKYKPSNTVTGAPNRYTQAVIRGVSGMISDYDRYKIRFQTVTSLRDINDIKHNLTSKNVHTEWELFRQNQSTVVAPALWNRLTEAVVGHVIGNVLTPVPSMERSLYDKIHGTNTRIGFGEGQTLVDKQLALSSILSEIENPEYDLYPIDKSVFLDTYNFDTPEDITTSMDYIYNNFSHLDTNRIFFACLNDALSLKHNYGDIMKTSTISLYGIRVIETSDRVTDD